MAIRNFLDCSTGHISPKAVEWLGELAEYKVLVPVHIAKFEYGWWLCSMDTNFVHEDLKQICLHAQQLDCDYILFDNAGPVIDLPVYDW